MKYIDVISNIVQNYVYCYDRKKYYGSNPNHIIAGDNHILSGEFLDYEFYKMKPCGSKSKWEGKCFGNQEVLPYLRENRRRVGPLKNYLDKDDKVIYTTEFHPPQDTPNPFGELRKYFFDVFFSDERVVKKIRGGKLFIVINYGFEPADMRTSFTKTDDYKNWYHMLQSVLINYNLPHNSIIFLNSNSCGYEQEKEYDFDGVRPRVIWDNFAECISLKSHKNYFNPNYTIEEHIDNLRTSDKTILRIHRTWHQLRDLMLFLLYERGYESNSIIEHAHFENIPYLKQHFKHLTTNLDVERALKVSDKIQKDLPIKCTDYEKNKKLTGTAKGNLLLLEGGASYSNEPIDNLVYNNTIFTWASTTFPDCNPQVFINQSTFSPILHYHPILWLGQQNFIKYYTTYGYKSFDWLFDESYDSFSSQIDKAKNQIEQIDKIMKMGRDDLIDILWENRDTLQHNRDLLIECRSIERIVTKLYGIINETEI